MVLPNPVPRGASWAAPMDSSRRVPGVKAQTHANAPMQELLAPRCRHALVLVECPLSQRVCLRAPAVGLRTRPTGHTDGPMDAGESSFIRQKFFVGATVCRSVSRNSGSTGQGPAFQELRFCGGGDRHARKELVVRPVGRRWWCRKKETGEGWLQRKAAGSRSCREGA